MIPQYSIFISLSNGILSSFKTFIVFKLPMLFRETRLGSRTGQKKGGESGQTLAEKSVLVLSFRNKQAC